MKKLLSLLFVLTFFGTSILTPISNAKAATSSKAESLVAIAEKHAGALKWQISFELTKEIKNPDMKVFNLTKEAYLLAKLEIAKVSVKEKLILETRLEENVGIHYRRAMGYIDAITSGTKITEKTNRFQELFATNPTSDVTEASYHSLSSEIRKQAILLYRVYGKSTRDAILLKYKTPGETALKGSQNVITAKMHLDTLNKLINEKAEPTAVEPQVEKFLATLEVIEDEEITDVLYDGYYHSIRKDANFLAQEQEIIQFFSNSTKYLNDEDLESYIGLYSEEFPGYVNLKGEVETTFNDFDLKYETLDLYVQYIVDGSALVVIDEVTMIDQVKVTEFSTPYLIQKNEDGQWKYVDVFEFN